MCSDLYQNQLTGTIPPSMSTIIENDGYYIVANNFLECPFPSCCESGDCECGTCYDSVPQSEIEGLTNFYKDTNGPQWKQSTNWLVGNPCNASGQWFGVECLYDQKHYSEHVGGLILNDNGVGGKISLSFLSYLTQLSLSRNTFDANPLPDLSDTPKIVSLFYFFYYL